MPVSNSGIETLLGPIDGLNVNFSTPTPYTSGTIRVFVNGVEYGPTDDLFGWVETGAFTIALKNAPRSGYILDAFYREADASSVLGVEDVTGSPFADGEV